jgi:hypothetical protein
MAFGTKKTQENIQIKKLNKVNVVVTIRGMSPLVVHAWDEKAKQMMRDKGSGAAKQPRQVRDPKALFEAAKYKNSKGEDCIRSVSIKSAMAEAATLVPDLTKKRVYAAVYIPGELLPIEYETCTMDESLVRVGMGTADLRYRPKYEGWSINVPLIVAVDLLSLEQVYNLLDMSGFSIGINEHRPACGGDWGRFEVAADAKKGRKAA